jgi:hypothetical protein
MPTSTPTLGESARRRRPRLTRGSSRTRSSVQRQLKHEGTGAEQWPRCSFARRSRRHQWATVRSPTRPVGERTAASFRPVSGCMDCTHPGRDPWRSSPARPLRKPRSPASGPRVLGGAEKPLLARHIRSSKRRRQDAYATPRRRRTRMRSRRLSLRLRGWLCSPARTPCCRSSSISTLTLAIGRLPQPRGERHSRGGGLATAWFVTFSQAELQGAGASEPGTRMPPAGASTDHGERRPRSPTRQWCWLWPGHPAAARTSPAIRSDSCARPTPCLVAPFSGSCR